jgi:PAS domain S-box-containing protein
LLNFTYAYLERDLALFDKLISHVSESTIGTLDDLPTICDVTACLVALVMFGFELLLLRAFTQAVVGVKQLVGVLPPTEVVDSDNLMQFVDGTIQSSANDFIMSPAQMILSACATAAIYLDNEMTIQIVNTEVKKITGFTPDQLIGRHIDWVIGHGNDHNRDYDNQRLHDYLCESTEAPSSEFLIQVTLENGGYATMTCNILSLPSRNSVLFLRDITEDTKQRQFAEVKKARTEQILQSLMPTQIREGGCQTVETVTLIFLEIIGITECVHTSSQQELLASLNRVYESFETLAKEIPSFTMVKSYEELLVGATGLLEDLAPAEQIDQALTFCFSAMDQADSMNDQLDLNLRLKVVINTGGPVMFGALSQLIPNFEIFGELVTDTQALLMNADVGTLRIGPGVRQHLDPANYVAREVQSPSGPYLIVERTDGGD